MDQNPRAAAQGHVYSMNQNQGPVHAVFQDRSRTKAKKEEKEKFQLQISGNIFIRKFLDLLAKWHPSENITKQYMEKVLHTVFFFGRLNQRQLRPQDFLDDRSFNILQRMYPQSFQQYSTHLPSLTPYSILLQFGREVAGCKTQEKMESFLHEFNSAVETAMNNVPNLKVGDFIFRAAVVAYSFYREPRKPQNEAGLPLFYGASLSCKGWIEKKIMISILCLRTWHKAVAFAVYHGQDNLAIVFPDGVQCRAFYYMNGAFNEKSPCVNCKMMYRVNFQPYEGDNREDIQWPHGNCAENECLSKLLHSVQGLQDRVVSTHTPPQPNTYSAIAEEFENDIEESLRNQLTRLLQGKGFPHHLQFFEP